MVPRAVRMSKAVANTLSPTQLAEYGNILAATYRSWQNNSSEYYTNLTNTYGVYPGAPTMFTYWIPTFNSSNAPTWAMPPVRVNRGNVLPDNSNPSINNPSAIQYSFIAPRANNPVAPPIGTLA
jgi:hypothetical protein